jgi:preprotein translocase subunit SecD
MKSLGPLACADLLKYVFSPKSPTNHTAEGNAMMSMIKVALAILFVSMATAYAQDEPVHGHQLRLFAVDQPSLNWITENDVHSAERINTGGGQPTLRLHLKPDAAQRMLALTGANIGKTVRVAWDGNVISELKVASAFGATFELPAPPK